MTNTLLVVAAIVIGYWNGRIMAAYAEHLLSIHTCHTCVAILRHFLGWVWLPYRPSTDISCFPFQVQASESPVRQSLTGHSKIRMVQIYTKYFMYVLETCAFWPLKFKKQHTITNKVCHFCKCNFSVESILSL